MIRNFFQRLTFGRYGSDQLNVFMLVVYIILYAVGCITKLNAFIYVSLVLVFLSLFRIFSRNIVKRQAENEAFLKLVRPVTGWFRMRRTAAKDKEHCYFCCPTCGQQMRAPKGKGRLMITCHGCHTTFEKKT